MVKWTELHTLQAKYENFVTLTVSRQSARQYCKCMNYFFDRFPDKTSPQEFTRADVEDYRLQRLREGLSPVTINYHCVVLRGFWKWLMDMEVVTWNPFAQIKRLKTKEPQRRSMAITEQTALLQGAFTAQDRMLIVLSLSTGLRGETLSQLTKQMVDYTTLRLTIPAEIMKSGRSHEIPITRELAEMIFDSPHERLFEGYAKDGKGISYRFNQICRRAKLPYKGIRTARRTFATTLLRGGTDIKIVQDLLGHKNLVTTSRYVTPADSAQVRTAINSLPKLGVVHEGL